ncbi:MAG: hypothetical protein ACRDSE_20605, partial [Pseudonocardiaceae bacterium]
MRSEEGTRPPYPSGAHSGSTLRFHLGRSGGALVRDSSVDDRTCHLHRMGELVTRSGSQAHPWLSALVL